MTNKQLWQAALGELELSLSKANFITWFKNTFIVSKKDEIVTISVPNGFTKEWLENKYNKPILRALQDICPEVKNLQYVIGAGEIFQLSKKTKKEPLPREEIPLTPSPEDLAEVVPKIEEETNLNPRYTFKSFIIGSSNELSQAAAIAVTKNLGQAYNPLFIYGGVGLGKTHLLQAIGNEVKKRYSKKKVCYISSETFMNELISAISNRKTNDFKNHYRGVDVLIIDDIQFLAGKEKTQEEFFHTFNALYGANKQIVLSSDRPPKAIATLEERLKSRFEGGMIADIGYPDFETRAAILKTKIKEKNFNIPAESLDYIASHIQRNVRELEGALNRVIVSCQLNEIKPDLNNTTKILSSLISPSLTQATSNQQILKTVADFYDLPIESLIERSRKKEIVRPRQIAMYLMRKDLKSSYPSIGAKLGGRDHTTAIHAYEKIEREIEGDERLEQEINLIKERLYAS